jgi:amino acid adenylation domain-containing protein/FkbH-like protein
VAEVWAEVLEKSSIAITDNFFDLGGDSLKAMEVIARLHASLGVEIPLLAFFEDPTVAHAAEVVDSLQPEPEPHGMTSTQSAIAKLWSEVLQTSVTAASQNFFDLGGDSLKAMEVISRVHAALGVEFPLIAFFEDPTVAHAAAVVDSLRPEETAPLAKAKSEGPLPLSFPQLTFWLLEQSDPLGYLYIEPRVIRIAGKLRADLLQQALDAMCRRHDSMHTRFVVGEGEPSQIVVPDAHLDLPVQDLSSAPLADAERAAMAIARKLSQQPFDLSLEAPIRARLLKLALEDHVLVVVIHHVLSDGHTCAIFFEELGQIYSALLRGTTPALPEVRQYQEYAQWERTQMQGPRLDEAIAYWRQRLEGAPAKLDLLTDKPHPGKESFHGESRSVGLRPELVDQLKSLAQANGTTLFSVLTAGLRILLHRWTGQQDIVIGTVVSNRSRAETERMLGCFLNFLPLRGSTAPQDSASSVLIQERGIVMDAFAHQAPFVKIASLASRRGASSPVYNVALLLQNFPEMKFEGDDFSAQFLEQEVETALLDLRLIAQEISGELRIDCDFKTDLFEPETISELLKGYTETLTSLTRDPSRLVSQFEIPAKLAEQADAARRREKKLPVVVASTFTAEPIEPGLAFWMKELGLPSEFHFAPYNQVFQQLLDPGSRLGQNREGFNILLVRPTDWQRFETNADPATKRERIEESLKSLVEALKSPAWSAPLLVCFCPAEKKYRADSTWREFLERIELQVAFEMSSVPGVHVVSSQDFLTRYPVENFEDEYADRMGHIPFTQEFFNAIATMLARRIYSLRSTPRKVIVLDCDNTLWKGVCGEEGPAVLVDAPRKALQKFMLDQQKAGMLLCLCSKNVEEDVDAVFAENPGMLLRPEDIAGRRVNWNPKSQNLRELATMLQLGIDSFIFVDDNPLECAEVEASCPEVLTLQLPQDAEQIPQFLNSIWAFDHWKVTEEDAQRTAMYRQNVEREQLRQQSTSLNTFLASLELRLDIRPMEAADLARVSQLTERTNQFNFTTIRRDEAAVTRFLEAGGECLVVTLADRFGDYGLVGVMFYKSGASALEVDTVLLSCRALGRKVEHNMLARLGAIARERGLERVIVPFAASKKNQPAADFLNSVGEKFRGHKDQQVVFDFPARHLSELHLLELPTAARTVPDSPKALSLSSKSRMENQNRLVLRVANELGQISTINRAIDAARVHRSSQAAFVAPRTPVEEMVAGIWAQVLKIDSISVNDNFFTLGGQSLLATQVIARIRHVLGVELPLRTAFEASTIAELSTRIEAAQRAGSGMQVPPITRQAKTAAVPLSFAQQRLWFLDQLESGNPLYNIAQMLRMRGRLDLMALHRSLNQIVERHESLRTRFDLKDGEPVQIIAPHLELALPILDLSDSDHGEDELRARAKEEVRKPFDLARGPLLRAEVLRLGSEDHALLLTMHHVISDRWSLGVMASELASHYEAFATGRMAAAPSLPVQYSDYAAWQRSWLQGPALAKQADYWKRHLAGAPAVLELPTDRPRPAAMTNRGATLSLTLSRELLRKLVALSQGEGATLFMTLLAGFQSLLARYSGQDDIVVGSPIANRQHAEIEPLIGFFVNTLAIRGDLSGNPSFRQVIARAKNACLQAYAHQDIPFEKLVEELNPERSLSYSPIFQVMFALQNAPMEAPRLQGLAVERSMVYPDTSMFDMSWFAIEVPEGLMLRAEYATDLFDRETVNRALGHFRQLLESAVANPELRISQLSILDEAERQKILVEFNSTEAAFPTDLCLDDLVEQTAARLPDLDAVVCESQRLSYRELNQRANQIADYLIKNGAGPDVLVGIFLERNLDLLPAILGVLKSGSAYVPLDPSYPRERLAAILEDGKAPLVITQESLVDQVEASGARCVCLDSDWAEIGRGSTQNPNIKIEPHHLAYVLFTSGSTGRPKGVALEHQSAVTFVHWAQTVFTPRELAGVLLATSVCFDLSIFEIFAPLSVGGKVILVQNALYLPSAEAKEEVTLINTVPSAMAELVQMKAVPSSVKTINLAGEALPESLVNDIYRTTSVERLYNLYGPTEDTTYSTYTLTHANQRVTIGRPLPNTQAYVVDAHGNPQPIGVPGELHLSGAGLARGYYGRRDLTSERFLSNPFSAKKNARMYRTGDLCRWLPDGNLEYLGRLDHQVKLRGFRIELGEIESVLSSHARVRQCLVMAREDEPGRKRLVAYVVPDSGPTLEEETLREHLNRRLPEFMIPTAFVVLDGFPLSPNGKINRKALPAPEYKAPTEGYVAPRSPIEEVVAGIWAEVLRLPQVGVNDEFFSLGGHSLLATQVVSRIRQACRVEVPLRALFETPTIAGLAALIEKAGKKSGDTEAPPMLRVARDQELPLSFAQQRLWFLDQLEPDNPFYNIPQGLRMHGELDQAALERSLTEIVRRHEVLRTTYKMLDGRAVQFISPQPNLKIESVDLTGLPEAERETQAQTFAAREARRAFRIDQGPVMRAYLLQLADHEHILILNTHHVASDGWSMALYVRELSELYSAFVEGKPSPLPELPIQYVDFALWQRKWIQGETLERHMAYWRKQLAGAPPTLELHTDRPRPAVQTFRGQTRSIRLPLEILHRLKKLSQLEGATLYMTLLAAFQTLLYRYTGQEDIVVGSPIANRNRAEIEDLIGFFVNALTMRTKLNGNPTFRELMARVREVALEAYAHQDLPFEKLVEEFDPERSLGHNPLFQVLFVLQNAPKIKLDLPGLKLEWLNLYSGTAKFDLALHIAERQDGLNCMMEFNTDLFDETTVARMLGHYQTLLEAIIADPACPIAFLPILTTSERQKLLVEFNHAGTNFAPQHCIHELVEAQAARTPDKVALVFGNHRITYRELNERANQLAHFLQKKGVGPETLVGMWIERSLEMVIGIIAILKAGGAYLPFDIAYPPERLAFMIDDAKPPIVLTQEKLIEQLPAQGARIVCLDKDWPTIASENKENPNRGTRPENLAYVIYTSGSTGKPKGCLVTHYNVVRLMQATWDWYEFDERDVWTMFHSYAFDFSVWELWGALFYGGRVVIVPYLVSRSPEEFYKLLADESVTVLNQTPSSFRQLMQAEETVGMQKLALRYVVFGGEALDMQSLKPWFERHGDQAPKLINMYGITETTVHVTYRPISITDTNGGSVIGQPISDLQLYILDQHRQPLPIGIPGEMYVGGAGVARGYLNRPELTAERFIADPFSGRPGARLYKTGDLARYLPNGDVEYLGRIDHQVKIRGFRIELGEIESVIHEHPAVHNTIVLVREDEPGNKQLVAYVVANKNYQGEADPSLDRNLKDEQVSQWEMTFDETYSHGSDDDPEFNIVGWNSSYSGQPYPAEHMREWVDFTVERICALKPKSLLEIGCGTGLLLLRIAPDCRKYLATDFSEKAITRLQRITHQRSLSQVSLAARRGDDFAGIEPDSFDTAVINSVLQYFPSIDYLMTVMEGMIRAVAPGGKIFLGDIRSLPLLEAFHAAVQLEQSPGSLATDQFAQRIRQRVAQDEELVLDPALFHELKRREPKLGRVEIQIKRGRHRNEMTQFRYDVVLHIGPQPEPTVDCAWLDWKTQALSVGMLDKILQETKSDVLAVSGIPNARVTEEVAALRLLGQKKRPANVEQVKLLIRRESFAAVAPEDIWEAANSQGFDAEINWSAAGNSALDVVFRRRGASCPSAPVAGRVPEQNTAPKPWSFYANNPLAGKIVRNLVPQLRQRATEKLPEYMVPSAFVVLDSLPLTENGKVDRRALPAPDQLRPELEGKYVAPRTPSEELVAGIWAEVLKIERVGVQDDFFDLGGHSLNATQVISRVRESFKVEMPLRALFESPTIEALARTIAALKRGEAANQMPPMVALARDRQLPLSFAQQRLWFLDQMDPGNHLYNVPRAFRLAGELDVSALECALNDLIARHEILRTNYTLGDRDQPVQVIAVEMKIELPLIDLSGTDSIRREQEARRIVQEESDRGFDLARDPMLRAVLLKLSDTDHVLFMNTHHIASDGWSTGVMVNDLCAFYEAAAAQKTAPLPPLAIQYADYSCWQRGWLQGEVLDKQLSYWKEQLSGAPPLLAMPTDRPRPSLQTYRGAMLETAVSRNITEGLNAVGRQHGATMFMTMLAGFECLMHYSTGQSDIVLGTDLANRTSLETEALIGFFVNLLPLRVDVSGDPTFIELMGRVRDVSLNAYAHQDVPFDKLVEELKPERNLSYSPLVQVLFVQQNTPRATATMPGIEMSRFKMQVQSKFDMAVFMRETGGEVASSWQYNPDLFDEATISRLASSYEVLLQAAIANPKARVSSLCELLAEADRTRRGSEQVKVQKAGLEKLKAIRRKAVADV